MKGFGYGFRYAAKRIASRTGPGFVRPTFGLSPLFLYHPQTESVVLDGSNSVVSVLGQSSPPMTAPVRGPQELTDPEGRKFWRFRGTDYLEIAPANLTITPRSLTVIAVFRDYGNTTSTQIFGQSYMTDGVTPDTFSTPFLTSRNNANSASFLGAPGATAASVSGGLAKGVIGAQLQVAGIACNGSRTRFMVNEWAGNGAVADNFNTNQKGARIGGYVKSQGSTNFFDLYALVGFAGTLTDAEADAAMAALVANYAIQPTVRQIVCEGDSITSGGVLDGTRPIAGILSDPGRNLIPPGTRVINVASTGAQTTSLITRRDATNGWPTTLLPGGPDNNIVLFQIGVNDRGTRTEAQAVANVETFLAQATTGVFARGWNAVLGINIACSNSAVETYLENLRVLYRGATFLTNIGANPGGANEARFRRIELEQIFLAGGRPFEAPQNAAYYMPDGLHPNLAGATLLVTGGETPTLGWGTVAVDSTFYSMLNTVNRIGDSSGFSVDTLGATWQLNGGPSWVDNMTHSIRWSGKKQRLRFELQNTDNDKSVADTTGNRRIELDPNETLTDGVEYWAAFTERFDPYTDPAGMNALGTGTTCAITQVHFGTGGGSPAIAIRRRHNGNLLITTRGLGQASSIERFDGALASYPMGVIEDFVMRYTLHPTNGALQVWRNGIELLNLTGIPLGQGDASSYQKFGIYAAGGTAGIVSKQVANLVKPQAGSLLSRVSSPPAWPQDRLDNASAPTVTARATSSSAVNAASFTPTLAAHVAGNYLMVVVTIDGFTTLPTTATSGWERLIVTNEGTNVMQAVFYYGSGGVMTPAPSNATPAPVITQASEQDSAIAFTIQAASAPTIEAAGAIGTGANGNPPSLTLAGGERPALWIAAIGIDGNTAIPTAGPPGYGNLNTVAGGSTGSTITGTSEWRGKVATENPGIFIHAAEQRAANTIAISVPA